jgi:GNAT superfamily N-acetyltransferase
MKIHHVEDRMEVLTVEISRVKSEDPLFLRAAEMVPQELWGPNFTNGAIEILDTADVVFVAHIGKEVIGSICLTRYQGCPDNRCSLDAWVRCWYLKEEHRGRRYGLKLLERAIAYAREYPQFYKNHLYAENNGDFLKKVNDSHHRIFVEYERTICGPNNAKLDIYWILLN